MRVTLVLTHQCNLSCTYCYAGEKSARKMSIETGWRALALAFRDAEKGPVEVAFFGGEPMLAFDRLVQLTRLATKWARRHDRRTVFTVTTNGTVLSDVQLRFFQHYGFHVSVSLDGLTEAHDRYRPFSSGAGSAETVWRNIERAACVLDHLSVNMVLNPDTVVGAPAAAHQLSRVGVYRLELSPNLDAVWDDAAREEARKIYVHLVGVYLDSRGTDWPLYVHPFVEEMDRAEEGRQSVLACETFCALGVEEIAVAPGGNIYPCARLVGSDGRPDLCIGDIQRGVCSKRSRDLRDRAIAQVRACGAEGHCLCVPLMPGDGQRQVEQMVFFERLVGETLRDARRERVGVT